MTLSLCHYIVGVIKLNIYTLASNPQKLYFYTHFKLFTYFSNKL